MKQPESFIDEIRRRGLAEISRRSQIADTLGNPGHHPGYYDFASRQNSQIRDISGNLYNDPTQYWMTEGLDSKYFTGDKKFMEAVAIAAITSITLSEFATPEYAAFLAMMEKFWPETAHVHTYSAGTLATDNMAKAMADQVMIEEKLQPEDMKVVALNHSFHGRDGFSLETTNNKDKVGDWQTGKAIWIDSPSTVFYPTGIIDRWATDRKVDRAMEQLENAFLRNRAVAGIILEYPFQAEGGVYHIPYEFLVGARKLCDQYHRFLGLDCVQMAGKGDAFPPKSLELADYVAFGKFFKVCGVLAKDPRKRNFKEDVMADPLKFGATWIGKLADMLVAQATISVVEKKDLWTNGKQQTHRLYENLQALALKNAGVLRPRIAGSYVGFDLETSDKRDQFKKVARETFRTFFLNAGETAIRLSPRLDVKPAEIDVVSETISETLSLII